MEIVGIFEFGKSENNGLLRRAKQRDDGGASPLPACARWW
jgi:hypothetical protein